MGHGGPVCTSVFCHKVCTKIHAEMLINIGVISKIGISL